MNAKAFLSTIAAGFIVGTMSVGLISAQPIIVNPRNSPGPATVSIIRSTNPAVLNYDQVLIDQMVMDAVNNAIGNITNLVQPNKTVLIKPNLVGPCTTPGQETSLAVTDWRVVHALVKLINDNVSNVTINIGEASASDNTIALMNQFGYTKGAGGNFTEFSNVYFVDLNKNGRSQFQLLDGLTNEAIYVSSEIAAQNLIYISVPKMKTHTHCGYTGALKNIGVGVAIQDLWDDDSYHVKGVMHRDIRKELIDHVLVRVPDFALVDAIKAMQGSGPVAGNRIDMSLILASKDLVAIDAVACELMGIPPYMITHQVLAANENIGVMDMDKITITGNTTIAEAGKKFTRSTQFAAPSPTSNLHSNESNGYIPYCATTVIRYTSQPVPISGDLDAWGLANTITADKSLHVKSPNNNWSDPADCSFQARFLYDNNNLYMLIAVRDNEKKLNTNSGAAIVNGEGIELYFSTYLTNYATFPSWFNYNRQGYETGVNKKDFKIAISYDAIPKAVDITNSAAPITLNNLTIRKIEAGDSYLIEAKIPWSTFGSPTLTQYRELGINLGVIDYDNSGFRNKLLWSNAQDDAIETIACKMGVAYLDPLSTTYMNQPPIATSIRISPATATVAPSGQQQFVATILDQYKWPLYVQSTSWSVDYLGSINSNSGMFVAGATEGNCQVIATDNNSGIQQVAPVSIKSQTLAYAVECGSLNSYTSKDNITYWPDNQYVTGGVMAQKTNAITGTNDQPLYQSERYGNANEISYDFPVKNGQYTITYHFAELFVTGPNQRLFNVVAEGINPFGGQLDIFARAGGQFKAYTFNQTVTVSDQMLTIKFIKGTANNPTIEAITIFSNSAPTSYTVAYDGNLYDGGSVPTDSKTYKQGDQVTVLSAGNLTKTGNTFDSWNTARDGSGLKYVSAATFSMPANNVTLYARWKPITNVVFSIECGSLNPYTTKDNITYLPDNQYVTGGVMAQKTNAITGTNDQPLYQSERYGNANEISYDFPIANGQYLITYHFAELFVTGPNQRLFNVVAEGVNPFGGQLDIFARAGGQFKAYTFNQTVTVNDQMLTIKFIKGTATILPSRLFWLRSSIKPIA
jgi:uncharacterized repeat protein (TIGR02543 family)